MNDEATSTFGLASASLMTLLDYIYFSCRLGGLWTESSLYLCMIWHSAHSEKGEWVMGYRQCLVYKKNNGSTGNPSSCDGYCVVSGHRLSSSNN